MFKIKLLLYKDLILNSRGCRKSNQLLRHPHCPQPMYSGRTSVERYSVCTAVEDVLNGLAVSIFLRFLSILPDVFSLLREKCAKF